MRLDDLARQAAADLWSRSETAELDLDRWRRTRAVRGSVAAIAAAVVVVAGIAAGSLVGSESDAAFDDTLPPDASTTTIAESTSIPESPSTPDVVPRPDAPRSILGAGWERLDYGPLIGGRLRMAATWTGTHLFVFGGHLLPSQEVPPSSEFLQDGYLYDPATGEWTSIGRPPLGQCHLGLARAIPVEGGVIVHGSVSVGGLECPRAARYDLETGSWSAIDSELFERISSLSPIADIGEMLVAPGAGLAYDLSTGETTEIPRLPSDAEGAAAGSTRAHWTGAELVVIGSGRIYSWTPGADAWRQLEDPPIPVIARDSAMTDEGILAVNYQMAAAFLGGDGWERPGDLPLRFFECLPEAVAAGGTPVVRMCSGIALWDQARQQWIPVPLEDLTRADIGTLVGADDALYSVGRSFRRFEIVRDESGGIVLPATIPIGVMQLDVPTGWDPVTSIAPVQDPAGFISEDETVGIAFERSDGTWCRVTSTYGTTRLGELTPLGPIEIHRPGRSPAKGVALQNDEPWAIVFAFSEPDVFGTSDTVMIECGGPNERILSDAASEFAVGLWSPGESQAELEESSLVITPQVGSSGTVITLDARDFPVGWSQWWLVDEDGIAVAQIPSDFLGRRWSDFSVSYTIDSGPSLPLGTYRVAVDGQVVAGATFTKVASHPRVEIERVIGSADTTVRSVVLLNREFESVDLAGWRVADETAPAGSIEFPVGTVLGPGERVHLKFQHLPDCPTPVDADFVVCTDPPADGVVWESIALRDGGDSLVDRALVAEPCFPWHDQPEAPACGFVFFDDPDAGIRYQVPVDRSLPAEVDRWHIADERLTPALGDPGEILSLATYPLRPGGDRCAQIPVNALEDLGPLDAFVSVQRRSGAAGDDVRTRPGTFSFEWLDEDAEAGFRECLDRADRDELYLRFASFREGDVVYHLIVALGGQASATVRAEQVLDILNGLQLDA